MSERDHPGVADQDVRGHREQSPDEDLGHEPSPELGQHERRHDQKHENDRETGPVSGRAAAAHFGVGTKRPVGRIKRVRMSTTNETITAWAGLTHRDAYASRRLMKIDARIEPARLPMPPTTTTMKALRIQSRPIA